jgi:tetratricopeptide (TPR) repeat protein
LFEVNRAITPSIVSAYSRARRFGHAKISEADNLVELFENAILSIGRVFIVLDGLDESPDAGELADTLSKLVQSSQNCSVVTLSRDIPIVRNRILASSELRMTPAHTGLDLSVFISTAVSRLPLDQFDSELKKQIGQRLQIGSNGMFLWASRMIQSLQSTTTPEEVHTTLSRMPIGLSGLYTNDLLRLASKGPQHCEIFIHASRWLLCSLRHLSTTELRAALAIDLVHPSFDPSRKPFLGLVQDILSPFFVFEPGDDILRSVHPSVADFILDFASVPSTDDALTPFRVDSEHSHQLIAQECLLLLTTAFSLDQIANDAINENLTRYACLYWPEHIIRSTFDNSVQQSVTTFLVSDCRRQWILYFLIWQRSVFPLQKLFYLQSRLQVWLKLAPDMEVDSYLDWASDVTTILLDTTQTYPNSQSRGQARTGSGFVTGIEPLSHFERMMVLRDLSRHLTATKRLPFSIDLFECALHEGQGDQNVPPAEIAWLLNVLGILYDQQGRIDKATRTQEEALMILSGGGYYDSSELIWTKNELGRMYRHQSRLEDAVKMHTDALAALERTTPDRNTDLEIAWTLCTVARVYRKQRRFEEAILHTRQALEIRRLSLGNNHPHCLWLLSDIAQCHHEKGDYDFAVQHHRDAYDGRRKTLGPKHPDTLWTMNNLAVVLAKMGSEHKAEALQLQRDAWKSQCEVLGPEHPHAKWTAAVLDVLAEFA